MTQLARLVVIGSLLLLFAAPAMAQPAASPEAAEAAAPARFGVDGAAFGAGIVLLGAGWGIGRIGSAAVESMSRQPEAAGNIQTAMIISAALIEGATFFALVVCLLMIPGLMG